MYLASDPALACITTLLTVSSVLAWTGRRNILKRRQLRPAPTSRAPAELGEVARLQRTTCFWKQTALYSDRKFRKKFRLSRVAFRRALELLDPKLGHPRGRGGCHAAV